jgi:hypothetical protein
VVYLGISLDNVQGGRGFESRRNCGQGNDCKKRFQIAKPLRETDWKEIGLTNFAFIPHLLLFFVSTDSFTFCLPPFFALRMASLLSKARRH